MKAWLALFGCLGLMFSPAAWAKDRIPLYLPDLTIVSERIYDGSYSVEITHIGALNTRADGSGELPPPGDVHLAGQQQVTASVADPYPSSGKEVSIEGLFLGGPAVVFYELVLPQKFIDILPRPLHVRPDHKYKAYGGTDPPLTVSFGGEGFAPGEGIDDLREESSIRRDPGENVGSYTIHSPVFSSDNYQLSYEDGTFNILPRLLDVQGLSIEYKVYDGGTDASQLIDVSAVVLQGLLNQDDVFLDTQGATAHFLDPEIGRDKEVYVYGLRLAGADAPNYTISRPPFLPWHGEASDHFPPQFILYGRIISESEVGVSPVMDSLRPQISHQDGLLKVVNPFPQRGSLQVFDLGGAFRWACTVPGEADKYETIHMNPGVYLLRFTVGNRTFVERIIIGR